ncbi:hypothetical protein ACOMHN_057792 [Nucella lapillus]
MKEKRAVWESPKEKTDITRKHRLRTTRREKNRKRKRGAILQTRPHTASGDLTDSSKAPFPDKPEAKSCVYLTDLGEKIGKTSGVVYVSTNNGRTWKELTAFAQENMGDDDEAYLFLERQLELFGMLCHGQNDYAIQQITKELDYLSWTEAFTCLSDTSLPDRLRAKYCDLIITLFVDIGDNVSVVDRVKLSYSYDDIDTSES